MPIDHIVVIAGLSCAGKSTIIEQMIHGDSQDLVMLLGMYDSQSYKLKIANRLNELHLFNDRRIILHYDLRNHLKESSLELLEYQFYRAKEISVLTINVSQTTLLRQNIFRIIDDLFNLLRSPIKFRRPFRKRLKYLLSSRKLYHDPYYVEKSVNSWNKFLDKFEIKERVMIHKTRTPYY